MIKNVQKRKDTKQKINIKTKRTTQKKLIELHVRCTWRQETTVPLITPIILLVVKSADKSYPIKKVSNKSVSCLTLTHGISMIIRYILILLLKKKQKKKQFQEMRKYSYRYKPQELIQHITLQVSKWSN